MSENDVPPPHPLDQPSAIRRDGGYWEEHDSKSKRFLVWLQIGGAVAGIGVGAFFFGVSYGSNKNILELPTKLEIVQSKLEQKLAEGQARDSEALKTQVRINEDLLRMLTSLQTDVGVIKNDNSHQEASIQRLERLVEDLRKIMK